MRPGAEKWPEIAGRSANALDQESGRRSGAGYLLSGAETSLTALPAGRGGPDSTAPLGRHAPCPCGSGRKDKQCCLPREQPRARG